MSGTKPKTTRAEARTESRENDMTTATTETTKTPKSTRLKYKVANLDLAVPSIVFE